MKTEEEIREMLEYWDTGRLTTNENMYMTAQIWVDCLKWVLKDENRD